MTDAKRDDAEVLWILAIDDADDMVHEVFKTESDAREEAAHVDQKRIEVIPVVPKSAMDAATALAEQAEAACAAAKEAYRILDTH